MPGLLRHLPHADGDRAVADETVEDRPEVEPDDVPFLQFRAVGDSVDDDVIHRGAEHGRIGRKGHRRVALEGRLGAASGQLFFRHRIHLSGGGARLGHAPQNLEDLENHAVSPVHDRDFIASLENRPFHSVEHLRQRLLDTFKDLIDGTNPVDFAQGVFCFVKRGDGKRLSVKRIQPRANRGFVVVRTGDQLRPFAITHGVIRRRSGFEVVNRAAARTGAAERDPLHDHIVRDQ
jgi:hypothetical protein